MKYRNVKTGVIVDIPSKVEGNAWEPIEVPTTPKPIETEVPKKKVSKRKQEE